MSQKFYRKGRWMSLEEVNKAKDSQAEAVATSDDNAEVAPKKKKSKK